jgi:hypothetical protein
VLEGILITLDHGGSIHGKLLVGPGQQADEFLLTAQEQSTQTSRGAVPATDGTFRFENLDPGQYTVQAMPAGLMRSLGGNDCGPARACALARSSRSSPTTSCRSVARCAPANRPRSPSTRPRSRPDRAGSCASKSGGQPFQSGLIEADRDRGRSHARRNAARRTASFAGIRPGPHRLQVRGGMTMNAIGPPQDVSFPKDTAEHRTTLSLPAGELHGRVVDAATGQALRTAVVRLLHEGHAERDDNLGMALTDEAGEFLFTGLAEGTYGLIAADPLHPGPESAASRREASASCRVRRVTSSNCARTRRPPRRSSSRRPRASRSRAPRCSASMPKVILSARPASRRRDPTDARGSAACHPAPRESSAAPRVSVPGASPLLELDPDRAQEFALSLPTGTRTVLQAVDASGRTLRGVTVTARWNDTPWLPSFLLVEATRADGALELGRLGRGDWEFRVSHPGVGTLTHRRTIGNEAAVTIVVAPQ